MANSEFLKDFSSETINGVTWQQLLKNERPIDQRTLTQFLLRANKFLMTEPGPNQAQRRLLAPDWLGWWINKLLGKRLQPGIITDLYGVESILKNSQTPSGALFCGGLEGHLGHREAVSWMLSRVKPVLLFEQDEHLASKAREKSFLPLEVRISMWSYFSQDLVITVLPSRHPNVPENEHYTRIFNLTGCDYHFATQGDPNASEKIARGKSASFTLIPYTDTEPTTTRVQKLSQEAANPFLNAKRD